MFRPGDICAHPYGLRPFTEPFKDSAVIIHLLTDPFDHPQSDSGGFYLAWPWASSMRAYAAQRKLACLWVDDVFIHVDFSGDHRDAKYRCVSIAVTNPCSFNAWSPEVRRIKAQLPNDRTFSYKSLGDRLKMSVLDEYLSSFVRLEGAVFCVLIDKNVGKLVLPGDWQVVRERMCVFEGLPRHEVEHRFQTAAFISFFLSLILIKPCNVWLTLDNDRIVANRRIAADFATVISTLAVPFGVPPDCRCSFWSPDLLDDPSPASFEEDMLTIPDLVGGALVDLGQSMTHEVSDVPISLDEILDLKPKAKTILASFSNRKRGLDHIFWVFKMQPDKSIAFGPIELI